MVLHIQHHLVARQVRWQGAVVARRALGTGLARGGGGGSARSVLGGLVGGDSLLQRLQPELQLVGGELLRPSAELVTRQPLDQQPELVILGVQRPLLVQHRAQHLLQGGRVVWQRVEVDLHGVMMTDAAASRPALSRVEPPKLPCELRPRAGRCTSPVDPVEQRGQLRR